MSATIYDVARRAGVSTATVSRAFASSERVAPATRQRVLAAAEELRWRPNPLARGLAGAGGCALGVVFPDLLGAYQCEVLIGFESRAVELDCSVLVLSTHGRLRSDELVRDLVTRVEGLVVMDRTVSDDHVALLERKGTPIVLLAREPVGPIPAVRTENVSAARTVTAHLLQHGHESVAFLGDPESGPDLSERWEGFLQAHAEVGRRPPDKPFPCQLIEDEALPAAGELLAARRRPSAVFCGNDDVALAVYGVARELGLDVPADVAVTGWDDVPVAQWLSPGLTTVRQPIRELGRRAAELLTDRLDGRPVTSQTLPTTFIRRSSCGCT